MQLIYIVCFWFLGIWFGAQLEASFSFWMIGLMLSVIGAYFGTAEIRLYAFFAGALFAGAGWFVVQLPEIGTSHIFNYEGERMLLVGVVVTEPRVREDQQEGVVELEAVINEQGEREPINGRLLLQLPRYPAISYGEEIRFLGKVERVPRGDQFDYQAYLARTAVYNMMRVEKVDLLGETASFFPLIYRFKMKLYQIIGRQLPGEEAALLSGILLGIEQDITPEMAADFRATGLTHIIVISGYNISLIIGLFVQISERPLGKKGASWFAGIGIILYTIMVGADGAVMRAAAMGIVYLLTTRFLGRRVYALASLFLAAWLISLFDPFILWDIGFQLSFMATLGLMLYATPITSWAKEKINTYFVADLAQFLLTFLSDAVFVTLAAQILTIPIMIAYFGQISVVSLLANFFVLPAQGGVMFWGGLSTLIGIISPFLGSLTAQLAWLFLHYSIFMAGLLAKIRYGVLPVEIGIGSVFLFYLLIGLFHWWRQQVVEVRDRVWALFGGLKGVGITVCLSGVIVVFSWGVEQPNGRLQVSILATGAGQAIWIESPTGRQILIDGGAHPARLRAALGKEMSVGDDSIDLLIVTNSVEEHSLSVPTLLQHYKVSVLVAPEQFQESVVFEAIGGALDSVVRETIYDGLSIEIEDGVQFRFHEVDGEAAVYIEYESISFLVAGSVSRQWEKEIIEREQLFPIWCLIVPSDRRQTGASFLDVLQPQIVISLYEENNRYPIDELWVETVHQSGGVILSIEELGAVRFETDGKEGWWEAGGR